MDLTESGIKLLEMLAKNEEAVSTLYKTYTNKFPEYKDLWNVLAVEEIEHASWLRQLETEVEQGSLYFNEQRFNEQELVRAKGEMSLINALSVSLYLEQALLERKYFEVFEGDSVELKHTLHQLAAATESHTNRVRETWLKNK